MIAADAEQMQQFNNTIFKENTSYRYPCTFKHSELLITCHYSEPCFRSRDKLFNGMLLLPLKTTSYT